eukprot:jgi/Mesvir1/20351/Mv19937-RA.1
MEQGAARKNALQMLMKGRSADAGRPAAPPSKVPRTSGATNNPSRASGSTGSRFGSCPVCGESIFLAFLERHASECSKGKAGNPDPVPDTRDSSGNEIREASLGVAGRISRPPPAPMPVPASSGDQRNTAGGSVSRTPPMLPHPPEPTPKNQPLPSSAPLTASCQEHAHASEQHVRKGVGSTKEPMGKENGLGAQGGGRAGSVLATTLMGAGKPAVAALGAAPAGVPAASNALSHLMAGAKQRSQQSRQRFHLEWSTDGGGWRCRWEPEAPGAPHAGRDHATIHPASLRMPSTAGAAPHSSAAGPSRNHPSTQAVPSSTPPSATSPSATAASARPATLSASASPSFIALSSPAWIAAMELRSKSGGAKPLAGPALQLTLSTNVASANTEVGWGYPPGMRSNAVNGDQLFSPSALKSILQKSVRLCRPQAAVRAALHLIKVDFREFIRRVTIVCLEDALQHPGMPLLMWLTAATAKGYVPSPVHIAECLRIVHDLASVRVRDPQPYGADAAAAHPVQVPQYSDVDASGLPAAEALLVKCMIMRAQFGGMHGDVSMLDRYAAVWFERYLGHVPPPPLPSASTSPTATKISLTPAASGLSSGPPPPAAVQAPSQHQHLPGRSSQNAPPHTAWLRFVSAAYATVTDVLTSCSVADVTKAGATSAVARHGPTAGLSLAAGCMDMGRNGGTAEEVSSPLPTQGPGDASQPSGLDRHLCAAGTFAMDSGSCRTPSSRFVQEASLLVADAGLQQGMVGSTREVCGGLVPQQQVTAASAAMDPLHPTAGTPSSHPPGDGAVAHASVSMAAAENCVLGLRVTGGGAAEHCNQGMEAGAAEAWLRSIPGLEVEDVPPSAIDFHCSNVASDILKDKALHGKVVAALAAAGCHLADVEERVRRVIWLFRSSINHKEPLSSIRSAEEAPAGLAQQALCDADGEDECERRALHPVWLAVKTAVERYSISYIQRRFRS